MARKITSLTVRLQAAKLHGMKTVTLWCQAGKHEWERPSQRGRRPLHCPEHTVTADTSGASVEKIKGNLDALEKARAVKVQRAQEREAERLAERERITTEAQGKIPAAQEAFDKARADEQKAFAKWDKIKPGSHKYELAQEAWEAAAAKTDRLLTRLMSLTNTARTIAA